VRDGVPDGRQAPERDGEGEAEFRAEPVDQRTDREQADRVGEREIEDDVAVVEIAPAELRAQRRPEQRDDLSVDVVDGGGEEEQRADDGGIRRAY
jgi:hypothetical protein